MLLKATRASLRDSAHNTVSGVIVEHFSSAVITSTKFSFNTLTGSRPRTRVVI